MNTKDLKSFFSIGMGWPIMIVIAIIILLVVFHPFDGTTMSSRQPLAAICRIQSESCSTECKYRFISVAETCKPIPWGPNPNQIKMPENCPCPAAVYDLALAQQNIIYIGTNCKTEEFDCTCSCKLK